MGYVISISNHKGGVGKTTSVASIGVCLAREGYRTLLIDLDPQANLTQCLGEEEGGGDTIYEALTGKSSLEPRLLEENLYLVASTLDLSGVEIEIASNIGRERTLEDLLEPVRDSYDYILIDCPPSLGLLTLNAFTASDEIYIPQQAQYLSMKGLSKLLEIVELVKKRLNSRLRISGVFVTQFDRRKVLNRNVSEAIEKNFREIAFKTAIRDNIALAEAPSVGSSIFDYAPDSYGAEDYRSLVAEILSRHNTK